MDLHWLQILHRIRSDTDIGLMLETNIERTLVSDVGTILKYNMLTILVNNLGPIQIDVSLLEHHGEKTWSNGGELFQHYKPILFRWYISVWAKVTIWKKKLDRNDLFIKKLFIYFPYCFKYVHKMYRNLIYDLIENFTSIEMIYLKIMLTFISFKNH